MLIDAEQRHPLTALLHHLNPVTLVLLIAQLGALAPA
jgi:hypothetical protein